MYLRRLLVLPRAQGRRGKTSDPPPPPCAPNPANRARRRRYGPRPRTTNSSKRGRQHRSSTGACGQGQARHSRVTRHASQAPPACTPRPPVPRAPHIQARRHLPPACATTEYGGGQQSARPWDRTTAIRLPSCVSTRTCADRGPGRPAQALTQTKPTPPLVPPVSWTRGRRCWLRGGGGPPRSHHLLPLVQETVPGETQSTLVEGIMTLAEKNPKIRTQSRCWTWRRETRSSGGGL